MTTITAYAVQYSTVLGERRTAEVQAATAQSARAAFVAGHLFRDDAAAADLSKAVAVTPKWQVRPMGPEYARA